MPSERDQLLTWEQAVSWLREQPGQVDLVRACYYDDPLAGAAERFHQGSEWQAVRELLGATRGRVLDLGAGRGISSYAFAADGWDVTALEPDPSELVGAGAIRSLSSLTGVPIRVVEDHGERLPFKDAEFDVVYGRAVLHHARDLPRFCREAARVLRAGGTFVATREHVLSRREDLERFLTAHPLHHLYGGEGAYLLSEYRDAIERTGLELRRVLNPYDSDINLFPDTRADLRRQIAARLRLPVAGWIPSVLLRWLGDRLHTPGRLYTFVAGKAASPVG